MNSKPHRNNSDFQLRYFLAGSCHTADGAYVLLYSQLVDMEAKVKHQVAQELRREAKLLEIDEILNHPGSTQVQKLNAMADKAEIEANLPVWEMNRVAATQELETIKKLMEELEPLRKYGHLDILAASEATQREEWLGELKHRAENFLLTQGTIPPDQLETMRTHPDFESSIVPHVQQLTQNIGICVNDRKDPLMLLTNKKMLPDNTSI
jgi:hypothetical protein